MLGADAILCVCRVRDKMTKCVWLIPAINVYPGIRVWAVDLDLVLLFGFQTNFLANMNGIWTGSCIEGYNTLSHDS